MHFQYYFVWFKKIYHKILMEEFLCSKIESQLKSWKIFILDIFLRFVITSKRQDIKSTSFLSLIFWFVYTKKEGCESKSSSNDQIQFIIFQQSIFRLECVSIWSVSETPEKILRIYERTILGYLSLLIVNICWRWVRHVQLMRIFDFWSIL